MKSASITLQTAFITKIHHCGLKCHIV